MGSKGLLGRQPKRHMIKQQKLIWLTKGQIGKKGSVGHCINSRQVYSKSLEASKSFLYLAI